MTVRRRIHLSALVAVAVAVAVAMGAMQAVAQPLVTGDLTIYYNFDNFTDVVTDGSGNGFNGKVRDATRKMTDEFERGELFTSGVISNDMSNPRQGAGAIRFMQPAVAGEDPVFLDMDGSVIKTDFPTKLPTTAATYAAWVNLEPVNTTIGSGDDWNNDGSFVQGSRLGGHGVPHFQIQGDGTFRLTIRDETGGNIVDCGQCSVFGQPFPINRILMPTVPLPCPGPRTNGFTWQQPMIRTPMAAWANLRCTTTA